MFLLMIFLIYFQNTICFVSASTFDTYYARIMYDDVYLYKSPIDVDNYSNIYFELPRTYFVELTDSSNNEFFQVNYLNFTGYVKKECVQTIVGTPKNPYLTDISFRVYAELSRDLRSEPTTLSGSSSQVAYIPLYSRNLTYYGTIEGETLIDGRTNIWYYCKYSADQDYYGYVYSDFCDELSTIALNTEEVTYTTSPDFGSTESSDTSLPLDSNATGIIIAVLSIPALIFVFMILKSTKILSREKHNNNKEIKDY